MPITIEPQLLRLRVGLLALASLLLAVTVATDARAQAAAATPQVAFALGDTCTRKTDKQAGIVKRDACGVFYCGSINIKDLIETRPHFAEEMNCKWVRIGLTCFCRPEKTSEKPLQGLMSVIKSCRGDGCK